jgi:polyisoprenoid-binding protein YceI
MKKLFIIAALALGSFAANAQTTWKVDNSHSKLGFSITHLKISEVDGMFRTYDGSVVTTKEDFDGATVNFSVDPKTINTESEARDKHLQQAEFFDSEKNGKIEFKGTSFKKVSEKKYALKGNLTIKGITKPVTFDVNFNGIAKDPWGNTKAGFKFSGNIKRTDFNIGEPSTLIISEEVAIAGGIELQKVEKKN